MATKFNDEQLLAIAARNDNILVAAGAGSGKSTVLVERLMRKIIDEKIEIDQFLIVTFTNLAAREMANKLRESLNDALAKTPDSQHLQNQILKLPYADISTFHGYCNKILQRYYYVIEMDADMQLMDDLEAVLLRQEALESFFEDMYEDADFRMLVAMFGTDRSDEPLAELMMKIYEIARANPDMNSWLAAFGKLYEIDETLDDWFFYDQLKQLSLIQLAAAKNYLKTAQELAIAAQMDEVTHDYLALATADYELITLLEQALATGSYEEVRTILLQTKPANFPRIKKKHWDEALHKQANDSRKEFLGILDTLAQDYFAYSNQSHVLHFSHSRVVVSALARVVNLFHDYYLAIKKDLSKLDFADLEQLTLAILQKNPDILTEVAADFNEIMIDEYQDTNEMQEKIVQMIASVKQIPCFMVGDVKQSIYRFRLAEPAIFQAKYANFQAVNNNLKIDLMKNYRSSRDVIDATNYLFAQIMDEAAGEIEYDAAAELKLGVDEADFTFNKPEVWLLDKVTIGDVDPARKLETDAELEAHFIAEKIVKLTGNSLVFDRKKAQERPVKYDDIVILLRNMAAATTFYEILTSYEIPVTIETAGNLLTETEIVTIVSALRVIDNPEQDIPLVAVMRSPLFFFTEPELATIRVASERGISFYESVKAFCITADDKDLQQRVKAFCLQLNNWRYLAKNLSLAGLLQKIYEATGYYEFVLGIRGGALRRANLDLLVNVADNYQARTTQGVDGFLNYLDQLDRYERSIPKAKLPTSSAGVKIMTIHKSKGLEFSVVFVSQLQKKFNTKDEIGNYVIHKNYGLGLQYIDPVLRLKQKTLPTIMLAKKLHYEMLAEEMRLLYVALTRAKSKLILTGVLKDRDTIDNLLTRDIKPVHARLAATRYLDWILPAVGGVDAKNPWQVEVATLKSANATGEKFASLVEKKAPVIDFDAVYAREYPLGELTTITAKQSVTQRKIEETVPLYRGIPEAFATPAYDLPTFMTSATKATAIGTAFHQFMQHLPITAGHTKMSLTTLKDDLVKRHIIRQDLVTKINLGSVLQFTQSALFQRMLDAKSLHKELPFTMMFAAGTVEPKKAKALLQGVVDLLVEFEEEVWIVDYKTDQVTDFAAEMMMLRQRYEIQMKYYLQAIRDIFPRKRVVAQVYFMRVSEVIEYE